jgi:tetraacyldisaccharide 4'-kinase
MALQTPALVILAKKRALAAKEAVKLGAEVLILDDGFQHLSLERDLDILMLQSDLPFGDGLILPAGRLRERPRTHLKANALVAVGRKLSPEALNLAQGRPIFLARLKPLTLRTLDGSAAVSPADLKNLRLGAFCGLARPESFKETVAELGLRTRRFVSLGDHARYGQRTLNYLVAVKNEERLDYLLTTAKDAVKLRGLTQLPILTVETQLEMEDGALFLSFVLEKLGLENRGANPDN